jgi:hypothetical protein
LHGIIVAHAYGVNARWIDLAPPAPRITGDGIKYADYLHSVGLKPDVYVIKGEILDVDEAAGNAAPAERMPDLQALKASFPWANLAR